MYKIPILNNQAQNNSIENGKMLRKENKSYFGTYF